MNIFECPFALCARISGRNVAITSSTRSWTYSECHLLIKGIAHTLKMAGVKFGERVALVPTKDFPTPLIFFALFRLGAIACPIDSQLPPTSFLHLLHALSPTYLIIPDGMGYSKIGHIVPIPFSQLAKSAAPISPPSFRIYLAKGTLATCLSTSGSTGQPKIACHSLGNHYYSALGSSRYMPLKTTDHYLLSLPLYHIAGVAILFRTFLAGATLLLSDDLGHPRATHLSLVPTQLCRLLERSPSRPFPQHLLCGGAPIPQTLYEQALRKGLGIYPSYGMSEMSSQIATNFSLGSFSLGHSLPYRELKVGEGGEIYVRGETLFQGYFHRERGLTLPLDDEGWFHTGDVGAYSPEGGLQIFGRIDRRFICGGENIYPEEIESILEGIEGVESAAVIPVADEEWGMRPVVHIKGDGGVSENTLKALLALRLPKFKIPTSFYFS